MEVTGLICDMSLCRLCGQENDFGTNLFPSEENEPNLSELVNKYLPLKVEDDQKFPKRICPGCNIQLEATKSFMDLIVEGQNKLRQLYKTQKDRLHRQEKQRLQLEEALQNVNPTSTVDTYTIESDETGEKFLIQIFSDGPLFPPDHELTLRAEGLDKPRRKRGRPPKPPPPAIDKEDPLATQITEPEVIANKELEEEADDGKRKRRKKVPTRYFGALQGKELDQVFKQEGVWDEESISDEEVDLPEKEPSKLPEEVIGRLQNENGEDLGQPVVVNKGAPRPRIKTKVKVGGVQSRKRRRYQCELCGREFLHHGRYELHKKLHEVEYTCGQDSCNFKASGKEALDQHQQETGHAGLVAVEKVEKYGKLHLSEVKPKEASSDSTEAPDEAAAKTSPMKKEFRCEECDRNFTCKQNYEVHLKSVHNGEKPYACEWCGKCFAHANTLRLHHLQHQRKSGEDDNSDAQYRCPSCPKVFRHPSSLQYHRESVHTNGRRFVCNKCDKPFKHRQLLQRHQLVHTDERPHRCTVCASAFKTRANLVHHTRTVHAGQRSHWCAQCGKAFVHKTALKLHQRWHTGARPYQCDFCQKSFSQKGNLAEHRRIHTGEKPYRCEDCGRAFTTSSQYRLHRKRHLDERPHRCEHCSKTFLHKVTLKCHLRRHFDERPFKCQHCGKTFTESWALKKHERLHTGEKPHKCEQCNKAFADSSNLAKHRRTHSNAKKESGAKQLVYIDYKPEEDDLKNARVQYVDQQENFLEPTEIMNMADGMEPIQLQQLVDQEGNPITFTTEDGQQVKVMASSEDGEENIQGLLPDGTLIPINFTTVQDKRPVLEEVKLNDGSLEAQLLDSNIQLENNIHFITEDTQNMCLVTTYNIADIEEQWQN